MKVDFIAGALPYAERLGWKVVLLGPKWKLPFLAKEDGGSGVHSASADPDQIRAWGKLCPDGNIGIACGQASGIVVIDVDPRNGGDAAIRALAAKGHHFPKGPRQRTGNGGWHLFFQHQPGIGGSKNKLGPGIDVKSTGGYVLAAPSWTRHQMSGQVARISGTSRRSMRPCRACRSGWRCCCAHRHDRRQRISSTGTPAISRHLRASSPPPAAASEIIDCSGRRVAPLNLSRSSAYRPRALKQSC